MVLKTDLEKTFDKFEWSSIRNTPVGFNFPPKLTKLIMSCVCSNSISIWFDDLIMFSRANTTNHNTIMRTLSNFYSLSVQRINYNKFNIVYSSNCSIENVNHWHP